MGKCAWKFAAAALACGLVFATAPAMAADYQPPQVYMPPPQPVYVPQPQSSCCCPTVRRGFNFNFSSCGYRSADVPYPAHPGYGAVPQYPQYEVQQQYAAPAYYQPQAYPAKPYQAEPHYSTYRPAYAPHVGVGIGAVSVGVRAGPRVAYRGSREHCWKSKGRWICR